MYYHVATEVEQFLLPRTNTNHYKALFLPSALSVFNENYTVIKLSVCMRQDMFLMEGWGCVNLMIFTGVFTFWFDTEKALFQVFWGLL